MSTWTNKDTTGSTSWASESDESTSWSVDNEGNVTQSWSDATGTTSSGAATPPGTPIGTATPAGSSIGTYDSAATAATSLVGSKYHLFDDKEFFFGTDQDIRISFDTAGAGMLIKVYPEQADDIVLMTLRNGDKDIVKYYSGGIEVAESDADPASSNMKPGTISFHNGDLWLGT
jgi:hypothetical protein